MNKNIIIAFIIDIIIHALFLLSIAFVDVHTEREEGPFFCILSREKYRSEKEKGTLTHVLSICVMLQ